MKVLHLPDSFLPWQTGGKEVFVNNLAQALTSIGIENIVAFHDQDKSTVHEGFYIHDGIKVFVLPKLKSHYKNIWDRRVENTTGFEEFLKAENPDIIHFHDQSNGASLNHLEIAKRLGKKTVLTFHSPGQVCPQRALMYKGKYRCDGRLDVTCCSKCLLAVKGIPEPFRSIIVGTNVHFGNNKINRITAIKSYVVSYINAFREIYSKHDAIQVHAKWCEELLLLNGVPKEKIFLSRQGIVRTEQRTKNKEQRLDNKTIKLLFIGRCERIKGVDVLIDAINLLPKTFPIEVHFVGPYWNNTSYGKLQLKKIEPDSRFKTPVLLPHGRIHEYMLQMDACVVPSSWPETGPLVVLEALNAQLPVIGSNYAGIAENIQHGKNGWLFELGNTIHLAELIRNLTKEELHKMKSNIEPVRDIAEMASDIHQLYKSLLA